MGVSLGYVSTKPVPAAQHRELLALSATANESHVWWCEPIWMSEQLDEAGNIFGSTKLFCLIDDIDTDTYMAYLDVCEIVKFLSLVAQRLGIEWRLEMEGEAFGAITRAGPDATLQGNLSSFLDMGGDFAALRARPREEILAQWADR
jgi:hypothetical protein